MPNDAIVSKRPSAVAVQCQLTDKNQGDSERGRKRLGNRGLRRRMGDYAEI